MPEETDKVVEHVVRIAASPETVFSYFTDPERMVRWLGDSATLDPRPDGVYRVDVNGAIVIGKYVQVDPPSRLVFTWGWEQELFGVGPQSTAVEVSFTPDGDGTVLKLSHRRLPGGAVLFHMAGWEHSLDRLATAATGGDPGPDPFADWANVLRAMQDVAARDG